MDSADLEDVTDLLFGAADELEDLKFIAKDDFDLMETMQAYELMDAKMDVRKNRA
jgi:hypothetical protein